MKKILIFSSILAVIDQLTKMAALKYLKTPFEVVENTFWLSYTENTGIAFGIHIPYWLLLFSNLVLLFFIIHIAGKKLNLENKIIKISLILIIGGAVGNIIDRIANGYVIDFISIWIYPSFNLADIFISAGILLILIFYAKIELTDT